MIRVIHYVWSLDFGGIERLTLDLAQAQNWNPDLQCAVLVGKSGGRMLANIGETGVEHTVAGLKSGADFSPARFYKLLKQLKKFDVIHLHTFTATVAFAACLSGRKIVYTEHGNFGFGRKFTAADRVNSLLLKLFLNFCADFVSFNSDFTRKEARQRYSLEKVAQQVIYNGTKFESNTPVPDSALQQRLAGKFVIGTSSRLAGFKRIDRLITAFQLFAADKNDVALLVVGDGPLRPRLESLVVEKGLAAKTVFAGYSSNVMATQSVMDVCVFPSQNEPFGIAALETLSLGKPTLVMADGGGILEIISAFSPGDVAADERGLAERMEHYYSGRRSPDPEKEKRIGYVKRFDIGNMQEEFYFVYKKMRS